VAHPASRKIREHTGPSRFLYGSAALASFLLAIAGLTKFASLTGRWPAPAWWVVAGAMVGLLTGVAAYALHRLFVAVTSPSSSAAYRAAFGLTAMLAVLVLAWQCPSVERVLLVSPLVLLGVLWQPRGDMAGFRIVGDNSPPPPKSPALCWKPTGRFPRSTPPAAKRAFDVAAAAAGLVVLAPLAIAVCLLLWLEDPGPLFFVKNAVGRGGRNFRQWKLRTMVRGAETESGPVWSEVADQRVLRIGTVLRKTALDELPQLVNILAGQMSVVGPRPQRTVLVAGYLRPLPGYADRHRLAPGLAGLAQVAGHYYITAQKLRFDRLYLAHAGLGFDLACSPSPSASCSGCGGERVGPAACHTPGSTAGGQGLPRLEASRYAEPDSVCSDLGAAAAGAPVRCAWIQRSQVDQRTIERIAALRACPAIVPYTPQRKMAHTPTVAMAIIAPTLPTKIARVRSSAFSAD
jgi:lipopolysaccharide/colanic/teichoic acid biosynthesis glycosyltransferase